jgi:uncharacterized membrane protein YoaK (UPF0700 family)
VGGTITELIPLPEPDETSPETAPYPFGYLSERETPAQWERTQPLHSVIMDVWRTVVPHKGDKDGPLIPMLIGLTVVSGMVDAFSFLKLGHIFVANVTGDVLFIAFGLGGAHGFSIPASLVTLCVFLLGALSGGRLFTHFRAHRGRLLAVVCLIQTVLFAAAVIVASMIHDSPPGSVRCTLIVILGLSMGVQNALALKLAVPGLTTSVVTRAITGISAESHLAGGEGSNTGARIASTVALFVGALAGALLVVHLNPWCDLLGATAILTSIGLVAASLSRSNPSWEHPS